MLPEKTSTVLGSLGRDSEEALSSLNQGTGGQTKQFPPEKPGWGEKKKKNQTFPTLRLTPAVGVSRQQLFGAMFLVVLCQENKEEQLKH